jgi:uncharacterized protein
MFPLSAVLFPHAEMPLHVFEPRYQALTSECLAGDPRFGIVLIERGSEVGGGDQRMSVGTQAVITRAATLPDGRSLLMVRGEISIRIMEWLPDDPYPLAMVEELGSSSGEVDDALLQHAIQTVRRTRGLLSESGHAPALSPDVHYDDDPEVAGWQICAQAPLNMMDAHQLLTAAGTMARLALLVELTEAIEQDLRRMMSTS